MTVLSLLIDFENIMFILNSFSTSEQQQLSYCSTRTVAVFAQVCTYVYQCLTMQDVFTALTFDGVIYVLSSARHTYVHVHTRKNPQTKERKKTLSEKTGR